VVQADGKEYDLTDADHARLEEAGASEIRIDAIMHPKAAMAAPNPREAQRQANRDPQAKTKACQDEAKLYFPNDAVAQAKALLTCMELK
jgi:hypothetical protein